MMAFDRMPTARLEVDTVDALRMAMQRALRRGDPGQELQDVLSRAANEARDKDIHAEQLLVILKNLWYSLPDLRSMQDTDRQTELLQKLISRFATARSEDDALDDLADPTKMGDLEDPKQMMQWMKRVGREMGEDMGDDFEELVEEAAAEEAAGGSLDGDDGDSFGSDE